MRRSTSWRAFVAVILSRMTQERAQVWKRSGHRKKVHHHTTTSASRRCVEATTGSQPTTPRCSYVLAHAQQQHPALEERWSLHAQVSWQGLLRLLRPRSSLVVSRDSPSSHIDHHEGTPYSTTSSHRARHVRPPASCPRSAREAFIVHEPRSSRLRLQPPALGLHRLPPRLPHRRLRLPAHQVQGRRRLRLRFLLHLHPPRSPEDAQERPERPPLSAVVLPSHHPQPRPSAWSAAAAAVPGGAGARVPGLLVAADEPAEPAAAVRVLR